jgi:hypothetical protein
MHMQSSTSMSASLASPSQTLVSTTKDIDSLFCYARWLQRNNETTGHPHVWGEVERLYRIAAEHGHRQAVACLRIGTLRGHFDVDLEATLRFSKVPVSKRERNDHFALGMPDRPSSPLVERLARAQRLDPATGRPERARSVDEASSDMGRVYYSGDICPRTGCWKMIRLKADHAVLEQPVMRYFVRGGVMPTYATERPRTRLWPFADSVEHVVEQVAWVRL